MVYSGIPVNRRTKTLSILPKLYIIKARTIGSTLQLIPKRKALTKQTILLHKLHIKRLKFTNRPFNIRSNPLKFKTGFQLQAQQVLTLS